MVLSKACLEGYLSTIIHKIFETNSSFHVKKRPTGKFEYLFCKSFWLVLKKNHFDRKTGY